MDKKLLIYKDSGARFAKLDDIINNFSKSPYFAGPCSLENEEMLRDCAKILQREHIPVLRAGIYKPRTSPYDFQGLGESGLKILKEVADEYQLKTVSEIMRPDDIEKMLPYVDILQVGSRNMQNFGLLKELGKLNVPVLLKRGLCSTVEEFLYAAEYIAYGGNRKIILCERGIRSFDTITRNLFDSTCIILLRKMTQLPIIADISHSLGRKDIINEMGRVALACGADGIMVEMHPNPSQALSDQKQQLSFSEFKKFIKDNRKYALLTTNMKSV